MSVSRARLARVLMDREIKDAKQKLRRRGLDLGVVVGNGEEKYFVAWDKAQQVVDDDGTRRVLKTLRAAGLPTINGVTEGADGNTPHPGSGRVTAERGFQRHEEGASRLVELRGRKSGKAHSLLEGESGQTEGRQEQDPA